MTNIDTSSDAIQDLILLMQRLRHPEHGCPWDVKQDFKSIVPSTLEEVYEVVEAIENEDYDNLKEELGDLLFQVVFYAQMADEEGLFDFESVAQGIVDKLVRRHPHVFPDGSLHHSPGTVTPLSDEELKTQWENIKLEEKKLKLQGQKRQEPNNGFLSDIPTAIPALQRAEKMQRKMRHVGFDWPQASPLFDVVADELKECQQAFLEGGNQASIEAELGDILFSVVNLARHLKIDPETALRKTNQKVEQRFHFIEQELEIENKTLEKASFAEMDALWEKAKR